MRLIFICLLLASFGACADNIAGRVIKVVDGDTVTIIDASNTQYKIRLSGIDAPEKRQAFGMRSQQSLSAHVYGKTVTVDWNKRDRYQRIVGKVLMGGQDVNLLQIRRGMAWHYKKYENEQEPEDRSRYAQAEFEAKRGLVGLWVDKNPVAPWDWRRIKK